MGHYFSSVDVRLDCVLLKFLSIFVHSKLTCSFICNLAKDMGTHLEEHVKKTPLRLTTCSSAMRLKMYCFVICFASMDIENKIARIR